jgi:hypothetical protein
MHGHMKVKLYLITAVSKSWAVYISHIHELFQPALDQSESVVEKNVEIYTAVTEPHIPTVTTRPI